MFYIITIIIISFPWSLEMINSLIILIVPSINFISII